jgi:hypothetical protein
MAKKDESKAKGGLARAAALTPEQRKSIALKAAQARHGVRATHKGSFKEEFGIDVECYVIDDERKTAVISQRGMGLALGLGEGGSRLKRFTQQAKIAKYLGPALAEKLSKPLVFKWSAPGQAVPPQTVNGYDVTILIDICKTIIQAAADDVPLPVHALQQANVIVGASAKAGITNLVYALAGYDATKEETVAAFKFYVREEAREYEKEFPDRLYEEWYRLYQLPKPERNKPWKFRDLTIKHVYTPLAHSNGKILELTRAQRAKSKDRWKKLHQFLEEIGVKALRLHLGELVGVARLSAGRDDYERHVERLYGQQTMLDLPGI